MDIATKIKHAQECDDCDIVDTDFGLDIEYCWRIAGKWHGPLTKEVQESQDRTTEIICAVYGNSVVNQLRSEIAFNERF